MSKKNGFMSIAMVLLVGVLMIARAQCPIEARVTKTAMRNGSNNLYGAAIAWVASGYWWEWQAQVDGALKFQPSGGSESTIASGQQFGWLNGIGSANGIRWSTNPTLESRGEGSYRTEGSGIFVAPYCGAGGSIPTTSSPTQVIERPSRPNYSQADLYLSHMNGATDNYGVDNSSHRLTNTVGVIAGDPRGATGTPSWVVLQSGSGGSNYVSISPSGSGATLTALREGDGCLVYNVQVKTSYDGFLSHPLYIAIEKPYKFVKPPGLPDTIYQAGPSGYLRKVYYVAEGLCSDAGYLRNYAVNEYFGTPVPVEPNNWPIIALGVKLGVTSDLVSDSISAIAGDVCGPNESETCYPVPQDPGSPVQLIQTAPQSWRIGSVTPGAGKLVQSNTFRRYRNNADHTAIVSPVN